MKVKVIKQFKDKYTKVLHKKDSMLEIDRGRFEEINSTPFGFLVKEINDGSFSDYADKYPLTKNYLSSFTKKELIKHAKEKGIELDMKMTKSEMIKELI